MTQPSHDLDRANWLFTCTVLVITFAIILEGL